MLQLLIVTNYSRRIIGSLCVSSIFIRFLSRVSTVTRDIDIAIPAAGGANAPAYWAPASLIRPTPKKTPVA